MGLLDKLLGRKEPTAAKQEGDPHALDTPGDPRGGVQNDDTARRADDVVEADGVVMSGPAGAPPDDTTPEERREADRP